MANDCHKRAHKQKELAYINKYAATTKQAFLHVLSERLSRCYFKQFRIGMIDALDSQ